MRRLLLAAAAVLVAAGCGGGTGRGAFARAEEGFADVRSGTVEIHAVVHALVPIERSATLQASEVPLSELDLTRWARSPHTLACDAKLECARADVDVPAALRALEPILPSLPLDPSSVRTAEVDVAVARSNGRPRWLRLSGDLDPGLVSGTVLFDVRLELSPV